MAAQGSVREDRGRLETSSVRRLPSPRDAERAAAVDDLERACAALRAVSGPSDELDEHLQAITRLVEQQEPTRRPPAPAPDRSTPRRVRRGTVAMALLGGAGSLLVADAVATVTWKEPITALLGHQRQSQLQDELAALEAASARPARTDTGLVGSSSRLGTLPSSREEPAPQRGPSPAQRVRTLATAERDRLRPGRAVGRLRIPRLGGSWAMIEGVDDAELKTGPGHYPTSSLPGLPGTTAVAGHRTTYGAPFRNIDRLKAGDRITVEMPYGTVSYRVEGHRIVDPSDTETLRDIGRPRLVLTACTPLYSDAQRWVVFARQVRVRPRSV